MNDIDFSLSARQKGFTLMELLVACAIIAIVLTLAVPNFSSHNQQQELNSSEFTVRQGLLYARELAMSQSILANFTCSQNKISIVSSANSDDLKEVNFPAGILIQDCSNIVFQPNGMISNGSGQLTLKVKNKQTKLKTIYYSVMGSVVRVEDGV